METSCQDFRLQVPISQAVGLLVLRANVAKATCDKTAKQSGDAPADDEISVAIGH